MGWEDLHGWFDFPDVYDAAVAAARDGDVLVEVGVHRGRSLAYLARQALNTTKRLRIVGIDNWDGDGWAAFVDGMGRHAHEEFQAIEPLIGDSARMADRFPTASCSFVFIDADHSYEGVKRDIAAWTSKVRPGGVLAGHDYQQEQVARAVHEAFGPCPIGATGSCWGVLR